MARRVASEAKFNSLLKKKKKILNGYIKQNINIYNYVTFITNKLITNSDLINKYI